MGLNVYFCDVCGVRVTDVDLRSGHGMLREQDVICATCLEQGHGKEWLASRGVAAPGIQSALAASAATPTLPAPSANPVIDHARDRARTVEDRPADAAVVPVPVPVVPVPVVPVAVVPTTIADEDTGIFADRRDDLVEDEPSEVLEPARPGAADAVAQARSHSSDFSGAASGFAALGQSIPTFANDEDAALDDAGVEADEAEVKVTSDAESTFDVDDIPLKTSGGSAAGSQETDEVIGAAALAANKRSSASRLPSKSRSDRLRRSVSGARPGASNSKPTTIKRAVSSVAGAVGKTPPSSTQSSAKSPASSRISKPKSGRSKRAGAAGGIPLPMKVSLITIPLILLIALATYVGPSIMRGTREPDVKDLVAQQSWIESEFSKTKTAINAATSSKDLKTLQAANAAWLKFNDDFDRFCKSAKQYSKWTEDNCDTYSSQTLKIMDVSGRMRVIRDEMVKQQMKSH